MPYDIGFVWRAGNSGHGDDCLDSNSVGDRERLFIRRYIDRYQAGDPPMVIEKTVGNSVRVPFVHSIFPDAHFVHLVRDGVDVAESTRRQWCAPLDRRYLLQKARHFPLRMVPGYGVSYVKSQLSRGRNRSGRVGSWGVRYEGIDEDLLTQDLLTVCARQWRASVLEATSAFEQLGIRPCEVRYEDLVARPVHTVTDILRELQIDGDMASIQAAAGMVSSKRVGLGVINLDGPEVETLERELASTLEHLGYARPSQRAPEMS